MQLLIGLVLIAALLTAGCTGTKTMAGGENLPAAGLSARSDYQKYQGELKDELDYLNNHYRIAENATMDEYRTWLGGLAERIALCRQMYNNTSDASKKYLTYLNASGDEYRNVTSEDALLQSEIESLNQSYDQYALYLNMSVKKMAALQEYSDELNQSTSAYNNLTSFASSAKVSSEGEYGSFLDGFKKRATIFDEEAQAALAAGEGYMAFLDPNSAEYKAVKDNNAALQSSVGQCWDAYNKYKGEYDSAVGAKEAAQSTFKNYADKVGKAGQMKTDLDNYRGTAKALEKLDRAWLDGYRKKIDAFNGACNDAIAAGNACKQYLDSAGKDYKSVTDNEKNMKDSMAAYEENYRKMDATYKNLHPMESLKR